MDIKSNKGRQLIKTVSPIFNNSIQMKAIFHAIGNEWENIDSLVDDIKIQFFPQTATWGLRFWEELLEIPVNEEIPLDRRRAMVLYRIKLRAPMTPARIANVTKSLAGEKAEDVEVLENVEPHVFSVTIKAKESGIDYISLYREIKRIKPSHESFYLGNLYSKSFGFKQKSFAGFSKIIHAIGTFVCSKSDSEFLATKGYRKSDLEILEKIILKGNAKPLICSKELKFEADGRVSEADMQSLIKNILGTSNPLVCSKDLIYGKDGDLKKDDLKQENDSNRGTSNPMVCSKELKFTRIEVV